MKHKQAPIAGAFFNIKLIYYKCKISVAGNISRR